LKPSYDEVNCMLEPNPNFGGGALGPANFVNCNYNINYFNAATQTWNCPWDVNSKTNWLKTDGT
jgi:hypothetical protein